MILLLWVLVFHRISLCVLLTLDLAFLAMHLRCFTLFRSVFHIPSLCVAMSTLIGPELDIIVLWWVLLIEWSFWPENLLIRWFLSGWNTIMYHLGKKRHTNATVPDNDVVTEIVVILICKILEGKHSVLVISENEVYREAKWLLLAYDFGQK